MVVETTRERILDAVHELLAEEHPAALSIPAVAQKAGTSLRTVYRYFPSKQALVDAASRSFDHSIDASPVTVDNLADYLTEAYLGFAKNAPQVRAQHVTPAGRQLRDARLPRARSSVRDSLVAEGLGHLPEGDLAELVDLCVALIGSSMFLELVDRLDHDPADAARLAAWVTESIVDRARTDGGIR